MTCPKCQRDVSSGKNVIKCSDCSMVYHVSCCRVRTAAKLSSMTAQALAAWKCDECANESASVKSDSDDPKVLDILRAIQREITESKRTNKAGFDSINLSLEGMQSSIDELKRKLSSVEQENIVLRNEVKQLRADKVVLAKKVDDLVKDTEDIKQYSRNRNIELKGIPLTKGENVYQVLESVAKALGIVFNRNLISIAHRLPSHRGSPFHPSIVCQFVSRTDRDEWIMAAKERKLQSTDLAPSLRPSPVYIVDHLTPHNKRLLGYAKSLVKDGRLAFAWSREGRVLVRKTVASPVTRVRSSDEVDNIAISMVPDNKSS